MKLINLLLKIAVFLSLTVVSLKLALANPVPVREIPRIPLLSPRLSLVPAPAERGSLVSLLPASPYWEEGGEGGEGNRSSLKTRILPIPRDALIFSQTGNFSDATGPSVIEFSAPSISTPASQAVQAPAAESAAENSQAGQTGNSVEVAVQLFEDHQARAFAQYFNKIIVGKFPSADLISKQLWEMARQTRKKAALIYVTSFPEYLQTVSVFPNTGTAAGQQRPDSKQSANQGIAETKREAVEKTVRAWRGEIEPPPLGPGTGSLAEAKKLYEWLVQPLEPALRSNQIDTLVFLMDAGLRSLPIAALHDGKQFLIEKYSVALIPSFGLTDTRYSDLRSQIILATGASEFPDSDLPPLPAVPVELSAILRRPWQGISLLNEDFTLDRFQSVNRQQHFGIIHLATHAQFNRGDARESFIQFRNAKLSLDKLGEVARKLGWPEPPPVEMLVLSACETALGNEPELGFAGIAVQTGVKSALASLWRVGDTATLALMSEFYKQLAQMPKPLKAEALRRTQLAMLRKEVRLENGQLRLSDGDLIPLPPEMAAAEPATFSDPHYWAGFTLIGYWN
ncbi:CHAT domain-containing protein [Kamptonema formosum]|uniref:CHAT domain-containing protein n=1 Tax=Kamptonema formosum TaxID=331992 RepID=UPI0003469873|nr:CHAT domain-containing protein [Oscillatoria sp. PCC 10802]